MFAQIPSFKASDSIGMNKKKAKGISNNILRRIFESKRGENEDWIKFDNDALHILYSSPNRFWVIKQK